MVSPNANHIAPEPPRPPSKTRGDPGVTAPLAARSLFGAHRRVDYQPAGGFGGLLSFGLRLVTPSTIYPPAPGGRLGPSDRRTKD